MSLSVASISSTLRRDALLREWDVTAGESFETATSLITYGERQGAAVVLKAIKMPGDDEWHSGAVVAAFEGRGMVRALEHTDGAVLLERLDPGTALVDLAAADDEKATDIIAEVVASMSPLEAPSICPAVEYWGRSFRRYIETGDQRIPRDLVDHAADVYAELCASQRNPRLLHGDLQHYNVLFDRARGWVAIDPKGAIGEPEYEIGALMRNPGEMPELLLDPTVIRRRLDQFCSRLELDRSRATAWTFAQAVLSVIWEIEDGGEVLSSNSSLALAGAARSLL